MYEAVYYQSISDGSVICGLCPHNCRISKGKSGICKVRSNYDGKLIADNYGKLSSIQLDPIEKKPLYHFFPGKKILSIGSVGCNLKCSFCQNCEISQSGISDFPHIKTYKPEEVVKMALSEKQNIGLAYTYNEPSVFYEFMLDTSKLIRAAGLKNVVVTNGFINSDPLVELLEYADAFNVDLKAFDSDFYKKQTKSDLEPVLEALKLINNSKKHLEITCLVVPGLNDDENKFRQMMLWISKELGNSTVLHLSRYFPRYKLSIESTPVETLLSLAKIAHEYLSFVYLGNVDNSLIAINI